MKKNVLVVMPVDEKHRVMLETAYPEGCFWYRHPKENVDLKEIHIIIGNVDPVSLKTASQLEWIQLNSAGADRYIKSNMLADNVQITNATGAYGLALSEHLLMGTFALMKHLTAYYRNQIQHEWKDEGPVRSVYGSRTLVVGLGDIGRDYGQKMKALGSYVVGIRRHVGQKPDWLDELYPIEALGEELPKADVVSLSLPSTPSTHHLIGAQEFSYMKKSAIFLNVGRGDVVVTDDLCHALRDGLISGAFLDVTDPEPLPSDHSLWDLPNVLITPHVAGDYHLQETYERIIRIACENLKRYQNGEQLHNLVDRETGYRRYSGDMK